jgi:excisionase family DNA binding protein
MTELAVNMAEISEPTAEDIAAARDAARQLMKVSPASKMVRFRMEPKDAAPASEPIDIPRGVFNVIIDLLVQVGNGNAVQLVPVHSELTTQQAADLLNVSRPHLIKLLNSGELEHRMVGTHRKLLAKNVLIYRDKSTEHRRKALRELVALDEEIGVYDDEPIRPRES